MDCGFSAKLLECNYDYYKTLGLYGSEKPELMSLHGGSHQKVHTKGRADTEIVDWRRD